MKNFEMLVQQVFYLKTNRMVFVGKFINNNSVHLPMDVTIFVNQKPIDKIKLTVLPIGVGINVRKDIDSIEASEQIDLKFINWDTDKVVLMETK